MPYLSHYGTPRKSGRYPWGSGGTKLAKGNALLAKGFTELEVSKALKIPLEEWRNQKAIAKGEAKESERIFVTRQRESGMSVQAIAKMVKKPASTVRDLLKPYANQKFRIVKNTADILIAAIKKDKFVDVGVGSEVFLGVSRLKLKTAIQMLENEGYKKYTLKQEQLGNPGKKTTILVLGHPDSTFKELLDSKTRIAIPKYHSPDLGESFLKAGPAKNLDSSRVLVRYDKEGGSEKDGLIELRRGVPELNLGEKRYAQVRIGVDDTHFMKGMAILSDDIPKGYDVVYNVSKPKPLSGNKLEAMKENEVGKVSEFGSIVKPNTYIDSSKKEVPGVINVVGEKGGIAEEGFWTTWRKSLASQILSKQAPSLAEGQLNISLENSKAEFEEIMALTNPTLKKHLLVEFADKQDRASYELKAAALPRQATHVLLPDPDIKPNEVYAPNYRDGEKVALVRYPHGGIFEIPELKVNNRGSAYRDLIGADAQDAIAIHPDVAHKLSGADFDGDTVLVIPNNKGQLKTSPSLTGLKNFDARGVYKIPKEALHDEKTNPSGIKPMTEDQKQREMGNVSNLITDMTIKGASQNEIARAVRHSMVVIDAVKHDLNYRQSFEDNGIAALKKTYQGSARAGASTLISKAKSEYRVPVRRDHYTIDPKTGEKVYSYTDETYQHKKTGKETLLTTKSYKLAESKDGYSLEGKDLSSGTYIESVYADYSNSMKQMANKARLASLQETPTPYSREAFSTYRKEVATLDAKYKAAISSKPIQRKAQLLGEAIYKDKIAQNPGLTGKEKQKEKGRALVLAQSRLNAAKTTIDISPREWQAIEMGAVSNTRFRGILRQGDMDQIRKYATPRAANPGLSTGKTSRAKALLKNGYTNNEVAAALGVPVNQIRDINK
jgi:hypothetical protein